jgi:hypothetical protein
MARIAARYRRRRPKSGISTTNSTDVVTTDDCACPLVKLVAPACATGWENAGRVRSTTALTVEFSSELADEGDTDEHGEPRASLPHEPGDDDDDVPRSSCHKGCHRSLTSRSRSPKGMVTSAADVATSRARGPPVRRDASGSRTCAALSGGRAADAPGDRARCSRHRYGRWRSVPDGYMTTHPRHARADRSGKRQTRHPTMPRHDRAPQRHEALRREHRR